MQYFCFANSVFALTVGAVFSSALNSPAIYTINHDTSGADDVQTYPNAHALIVYNTGEFRPWPCSKRESVYCQASPFPNRHPSSASDYKNRYNISTSSPYGTPTIVLLTALIALLAYTSLLPLAQSFLIHAIPLASANVPITNSGCGFAGGPAPNTPPLTYPPPLKSPSYTSGANARRSGLSPAEIAGIAVGAVSVVCLVALGGFVLGQRTHIRVREIVVADGGVYRPYYSDIEKTLASSVRPLRPFKPERPERPKGPDTRGRPETRERPQTRERPETRDRPEPRGRPERPERSMRPERPMRPERSREGLYYVGNRGMGIGVGGGVGGMRKML